MCVFVCAIFYHAVDLIVHVGGKHAGGKVQSLRVKFAVGKELCTLPPACWPPTRQARWRQGSVSLRVKFAGGKVQSFENLLEARCKFSKLCFIVKKLSSIQLAVTRNPASHC